MNERLDTRTLAAFVAVAEALSFRQAAESLHVSQPPLSRTIRALEDRLGVALFVRSTRHVALTPAGEKLLPRARRILRLLEEAPMGLGTSPKRSPVRLGLTNAIEFGTLLASVGALEERIASAIAIVADSSPRLVRALRAGRLDAALVALPLDCRGVEVEVVERQPVIVALAAGNALARRRLLRLEDLRGERLFGFERARQPAFFDHWQRVFDRHRFAPRARMPEPLDHHVLLADVAAGRAVALLPSSFSAVRRKGVAYRRLEEGAELAVEVGIATRPGYASLREALRKAARGR